ncbi:unnamed protein product [Peniophora sp. CBMAI 1063]|nr:unnamed protein product [Peniophora sp. CBMAI 1063]
MAIESLPQEVLIIVFEYVHALGAPTSLLSGKATKIRDRGMLGLSQVCRRWRQMTISLSALWATKVDVSCCCLELNRLVLERAGSRRLKLSLQEVTSRDGYDNLRLWFQQSHHGRIQSVDIRCLGGGVSRLLSKRIGRNLPSLQDLTVNLRNNDDNPNRYDRISLVTLPIRYAPVLKSVTLHNCILPWSANVYSQITHLCIDINVSFETYQTPTHTELDTVLSSMHQLVELYIRNLFPDYVFMREPQVAVLAIRLSPTCERVTLATLSIDGIDAEDQNFDSGQLAKRLVPPSTATFTLELTCGGSLLGPVRAVSGSSRPSRALSIRTDEHPHDTTVHIGFDAPTWMRSPADMLNATQFPGRTISIVFRTEDWQAEYLGPASPARIAHSFVTQHVDALRALQEIDIRELQLLRIDGLRRWTDQQYLFGGERALMVPRTQDGAPLLASAENLEVLILSDGADVALLEALTTVPSGRHQLLFLRLHTLVLRWPRHEPHADAARAVVIDFFLKRRALGAPVRTFQVVAMEDSRNERWEELEGLTEVMTSVMQGGAASDTGQY